ncbi:hypothetical protein D5F01_LYC19244 [Larimichthys crocea]|uniref:Uncharacterized protein n=1 Tax=Larimichthys crocea TaxID=215358 RepID=A0A6G0HRH0_LARCR|nr:hypothetical protein D5F01_LYC19244 [Larimichthys crocea]
MRKGQTTSSSSESEESQGPRSKDSKDHSSPCGLSSDEDLSSDSDVEAEQVIKRSKRFNTSFRFGENHQLQTKGEELNSNGVPVTELVEAELDAERVQPEKRDTFCDTNQPSRSGLFRPQALWLAMRRCLSLRWPPCLSVNRQTNRKLAYQVNLDHLEDTHSSLSSETTNESSSSTSSDDRDVMLERHKEEEVKEVKNRGVKSGPPPCRWVSHSSPRLQRARQAADSVLASMILEKETFLRIELIDSGDEREDLRYRAEWKLSERTTELAEGVWLSRSQKLMD